MKKIARDVMTKELISVTPDTPIAEFARICEEDNISGAPVIRIDGTLVGIVSRTDLVRRLLEDGRSFGTTAEFEMPATHEDLRQVSDIMATDVVSFSPESSVSDIAARMARDKIHRVVVTEGDKVAGIVTSLDVLGCFPG